MNRLGFLRYASIIVALSAGPVMAQTAPHDSLLDTARALRDLPYAKDNTALSAPFADLDYDAFRGIRPIEGKAAMLPNGPNFSFDLLPPGLYFEDIVRIDQMTAAGPKDVPFSPALFTFEPRYFDTIPETSPGAGFTGMRLRYPLNASDRMDEVLVLQGASYFRAIGQAMVYGLSARTVAIGTGGPAPEEFPIFTHMRVHEAAETSVRVEGIIDSPSLTGHLDLTLHPGEETRMEIETSIFPRIDIADIGIAPLTSMYLKGPMLSAVSDDFRPRVHDSDVLMIENGSGEHLWRPIANPRNVETSAFLDQSPKSFGLYQTPRKFEDYQDTEASYHKRPSAKVTPTEPWGDGAVMLVELPTGTEFLDNIVAFWRPAEPLAAGQDYTFKYTLTWTSAQPELAELTSFAQNMSGREHDQPGHRRFVIDTALRVEGAEAIVSASEGATISGISTFTLHDRDITRTTFLFHPGETTSAEIRMSLRTEDGTPLSPVWLHRWTPARDGRV